MDEPEPPRVRLGRLVRDRREALGISIRTAAKRAGISAPTWTSVENGTRTPHGHNARQMEAVVKWQARSFDDVIDGLEPTELPDEQDGDLRSDPDYQEWIAGYRRLRAKGYGHDEAIGALTDEEQSGMQVADRSEHRRDAG